LADPESSFYQEDAFQYILGKLGSLGKAQLKEKNTKEGHKLVLVINDILSIQNTIILLQKLQKPITA
jgi:hypothetical protein